jgi:16S rRNA (cytidine1402-2'-O)-methyltransferase
MNEYRMNDDKGTAGTAAAAWIEASGVAAQDWPAGALYVAATPIGNAADITLRVLHALSIADAVFAEDTRVTRKLLDRYGLRPPALLAAHAHNEHEAAQAIAARLADGQRVVLVSDAGTPAVSDPGARVVAAVRTAGHRVIPLPGASSALAALCASGLVPGGFTFAGFLPSGARERERALQAVAVSVLASVLFEAPHRIEATARALAAALPAGRRVVVARELTKKFESIDTLTAAQLPTFIAAEPQRGEYVLLVEAADAAALTSIDEVTQRWLAALAPALPAARAAAVAARATGLPRDALYAALAAMRSSIDAPVTTTTGNDDSS